MEQHIWYWDASNSVIQATSYDKKSYMGHIKAYLKRVAEKLKEEGRDVKAFQQAAQEFVAKILTPKFDDYEFYTGENVWLLLFLTLPYSSLLTLPPYTLTPFLLTTLLTLSLLTLP
jgi:Translationally controlled tumour protein